MNTKDLIGKTISNATMLKSVSYDDAAWLHLQFTDGTDCYVEGGYGGYTGESRDEYPMFVQIIDFAELTTDLELSKDGLVPDESEGA